MTGKNQPLTVGVTGLRDLAGFDMAALKENIGMELNALRKGHDPVRMLNSIADGADQLCAKIALSLGYELICPLPFAEYRGDFQGKTLTRYDYFLGKAKEILIVSDSADIDAAYLAAGQYIVDHCDVLVAVWDGQPQDSICGTAAVITYAKGLGKEVRIVCR